MFAHKNKGHKGNAFAGFIGGANYDFFVNLTNAPEFHRKAAREIPLQPGMRVLDLGCGTGIFSIELAQYIGESGHIDGVDISEDQLVQAREKTRDLAVPCLFQHASIDEVPFEENTFDAVVSAFTFNHVPPDIRRSAILEIARVLKPGGTFTLVDISKPTGGLMGLLGLFLFTVRSVDTPLDDHWHNSFVALCEAQGMKRIRDMYLNTIFRCQVFQMMG